MKKAILGILAAAMMVPMASAHAFDLKDALNKGGSILKKTTKWYTYERVYPKCQPYGITPELAWKVEARHKDFGPLEKGLAFATGSSNEPGNVKSFCETLLIALRNLDAKK